MRWPGYLGIALASCGGSCAVSAAMYAAFFATDPYGSAATRLMLTVAAVAACVLMLGVVLVLADERRQKRERAVAFLRSVA
jgi:hypothetical protein